MKKITYLFVVLFTAAACSVESLDSAEEDLVTANASAKLKSQESSNSLSPDYATICEGEVPTFTFNFPQNDKGNGQTQVQLQMEVAPDEWEQIFKEDYNDAGPKEYTYDYSIALGAEVSYNFRAKIGSGGFDYLSTITVVECSDCEESFTYVDNGDKSYTFTYVPAEDVTGAEVVFTFAQGVDVDGLEGWENNGQTRQDVMDLEACEVYSWTVTLDAKCSGNSPNSNVWTDFKVNDVSKKANEEDKFIQSCN